MISDAVKKASFRTKRIRKQQEHKKKAVAKQAKLAKEQSKK